MKNTNEIIFEIIRVETNNPGLKIHESNKPEDISDWDSLAHVKIVSEIEQSFGIRFSLRELSQIQCINDLILIVNKKTDNSQ